jgi:hypothetical protein
MRAQSPLRKTNPTVLPNFFGVAEELLQLEISRSGGFTTRTTAGDILEKAGIANPDWKVARGSISNDCGLKFVLAAGSDIAWTEGQLLKHQLGLTSVVWRSD